MSKRDEREQRHQASLARIQGVQLVVGRGDRLRLDHEGTLFERARLTVEELQSHQATECGLLAFDRLLCRVEGHDTRQARDIVAFLAAVWNNRPLPLATLRAQQQEVGDDMLAVLDAFRYARIDLAEHVAGGPRRLARVLDAVRAGARVARA